MNRLVRAVTIAVGLLVAGCRASHRAAAAAVADAEWEARDRGHRALLRAWVGCYELHAAAWRPDSAAGRPATFTVPRFIRLDTAKHDSYMRLDPQPDPATGFTTAGWRASGPDPRRDTLALIWQRDARALFAPTLAVALAPDDTSYTGTLYPSSDVRGGPPSPQQLLTVTRAECSSAFGPPAT